MSHLPLHLDLVDLEFRVLHCLLDPAWDFGKLCLANGVLNPKSTQPWYASWWITLYYHWTQHQMSWILLYVKALCLVTDQMIRKSCGDDWFLRPFFFHFIHSVFNMDGQWQRVCLGMCRFGGWVWMIFQCDHTILCRRSVRWRLDATLGTHVQLRSQNFYKCVTKVSQKCHKSVTR